MKIFKKAIFLLIVPFLFTNCASIFTKSTYPVAIKSTPAGATVTIVNKKG